MLIILIMTIFYFQNYAINLAKQTKPLHQAKKKTLGKYLDPKFLDYMTDEQLVQLYELHKATSLQSDDPDQINVTNKNNNDRQKMLFTYKQIVF